METLIGIFAGTSAVLGVTGISILQWKKAAPKRLCGEILKVSGARLMDIRSGTVKTTFALRGGEVGKVKSLGFKGRVYKKDFGSVKAIVGPTSIREIPFTGEMIEVKESDEPIYIHEYNKEVVATDNAEALERYIKAQKRNNGEEVPAGKKSDDMNASDYICVFSLLGAQYIGWLGVGLIVLDLITCKCNH
jgi:hypothetical protein